MNKLKVMSVFGTRPEAIKMAPLALELRRRESIESLICVTAQHREMLDSVMNCFGLTADADLNIMGKNQTLTDVTVKALKGLEGCFAEFEPDLVLVHGDTSTTFSAALAAFYAKIPVGHVEAGLRTYDRYSPFPEEMNRCLVGRLATLHFAPTSKNAENLRAEAVTGDIFVTGNTVIDAMRYTVGDGGFTSPELKDIDFSKKVVAMTCHRRENYGEPMKNIFSAVREVALTHPEIEVVYPVHMSPIVRSAAREQLADLENVRLIEPLDAMDMHRLMSASYMVMAAFRRRRPRWVSPCLSCEGKPSAPRPSRRAPSSSRALSARISSAMQTSFSRGARCISAWRTPSTPTATGTPASASPTR